MVWISRSEWNLIILSLLAIFFSMRFCIKKKSIRKYINIRIIIIGVIALSTEHSKLSQFSSDIINVIYPSTYVFMFFSLAIDMIPNFFCTHKKYDFLSLEYIISILNFSIGVFIIGFFFKDTYLQLIMLIIIFSSIFFIYTIRTLISVISKAIYKGILTIVFLIFDIGYIYFIYIENGYNGVTKKENILSCRQILILVILAVVVALIIYGIDCIRLKLKGNKNHEKGINNENTKN